MENIKIHNWKKNSYNSKIKMKFTINNETVSDIGPALADTITCSVDPMSYNNNNNNNIYLKSNIQCT